MKFKLTKAEQMLASIATTERNQALAQADAIYRDRMAALLDDHNLTFKDAPEILQEGTDLYLVTKDVPLPVVEEIPS